MSLSVMHASESAIPQKLSIADMGKYIIKTFRLVSTQHVYESYSSILTVYRLKATTGGL